MGKPGALDYLGKLRRTTSGHPSSTGKLQPKVSNGELLVANGDVQMNLGSIKDDGSKFAVFFPAAADGKKTTVSLPYVGASRRAPRTPTARRSCWRSWCRRTRRRRLPLTPLAFRS